MAQFFTIVLFRYLKNFVVSQAQDLLGTSKASLDKFGPGLLKLYWSKKGAFGQEMEDLLDKLDETGEWLAVLPDILHYVEVHYSTMLIEIFVFSTGYSSDFGHCVPPKDSSTDYPFSFDKMQQIFYWSLCIYMQMFINVHCPFT